MPTSRRALIAASLTAPVFAQPASSETVNALVQRSADANAALMRGDGKGYFDLVACSQDFTLMSPFGGKPSHGPVSRERMEEIGHFFAHGSFEQQLVQAYAVPGMVVLATIERAHVEVGGLPAQDWALRVTQVYRRDGKDWRWCTGMPIRWRPVSVWNRRLRWQNGRCEKMPVDEAAPGACGLNFDTPSHGTGGR